MREYRPVAVGACGRPGARGRAGLFEQVAEAPDGADLQAGRLQLGAQARDVHLDRVVGGGAVPVGDGGDDLFLGHDLAGAAEHELQDRPFAAGQRQLLLADVGAARLEIHAQAAQAQHAAAARLVAAYQRARPRHQLAERERLDEVVVGAALQAAHAVLDGVARGEHQHGKVGALGAHAAQRLEAVDAGQADVEDEQVVRILAHGDGDGLAAFGAVDDPALGAQRTRGGIGKKRVVFDKKDSHGRHSDRSDGG